ncbi:hypothetical protein LT493_04095 [Streptomyces tricolor]|nr:hypothetical protein [Streptomyces tricolor]
MAESLTPEQLTARTSAAVDAAVAAARDLGLAVTDADVLHDLFSVVVRPHACARRGPDPDRPCRTA